MAGRVNSKVLTILIAALVIMGGCSKQKGGAAKESGILLRWSGYGYPVYDKFRSEESKKFEVAHPDVTVKYEAIPLQYDTKTLTQIASNTAPDVFFAQDLNTYVSKGALVDLTDWYKEDKDFFKNIYPALIEAQKWNGKLYALPGNCDVSILFYNKDLFDQKGLKYPDESWTWNDFLEAAQRLTMRDKTGKIVQYGCVISGGWLEFILANGGKIWNKDRTKCIINNPEAKEALKFRRDLYDKYRVSPNVLQTKEQGVREPFIMGKVAMYWGNTWEVATFKIKGKKGGLNWDAAIVPRADGKERFIPLDYNSLGVWSKSKNPKLAYELAKFMIEPKRIQFLVEIGDSLPISSNKEAVSSFFAITDRPEKAKKEMLKSLPFAKSLYQVTANPYIPYLEQDRIMRENFEKFFVTKELTADQCLQKIEDDLNSLLAKAMNKQGV